MLNQFNLLFIVLLTLRVPLVSSDLVSHPLFLYPTPLTNWTKASLSQLRCPSRFAGLSLNNLKEETITIQAIDETFISETVSGSICYGLRYETVCSESFFGTTSVKRIISQEFVSPNKCKEAQFKEINGQSIEPYFPATSCIWMSENTEKLTFYIIKDHPVKLDPYRTKFLDSIFINKECSNNYCETIHQNALWFTETNLNVSCSRTVPQVVTIYYDTNDNIKYINTSPGHYESFNQSCQIKFCNIPGIRADSGIWFGLFKSHFLRNLPECPDYKKIAYYPVREEINRLQLEIDEDNDRVLCLNNILTMRFTKQISFLTLSYLTPKFEGKYPVFRMNNGTLEWSVAQWKPIDKFDFYLPNQIGLYQSREVFYKDWVRSGMPGIYSGYNGVHKLITSNKIIIPRLEKLKHEYSESLLLSHEIKSIPHVKINSHLNLSKIEDVITQYDTNIVNFGSWINRVWSNIYGKCFLLIVVVLIIIGIWVLYKFFNISKCCKNNHNSPKPQTTLAAKFIVPPDGLDNSRILLTCPRDW